MFRRAFVSLILVGGLASQSLHAYAKPSRAGELLHRVQRLHHASKARHESDIFHRSLQAETASPTASPSLVTLSPTSQPSTIEQDRGAVTEVIYIDTSTGIDPNVAPGAFDTQVVEHSLSNSQAAPKDPEIMGMDAKVFAGVLIGVCALIIGAAAYRLRVTYVEGTGNHGQRRRPGGLRTIEVRGAWVRWMLMDRMDRRTDHG
jgi:hypothetical protein